MTDSALSARLVPFEACFNFRDLGGYEARDGRVVRWGAVFRSDSLHRMTGVDLETFRALGIRTVFDLRATQELEQDGRLDASIPVSHVHLPVLDTVRVPDDAPKVVRLALEDAYGYMLDAGRDAIVRLFGALAAPGARPAVFHCTAGKDRTGIVAALLLGAVGVDDDAIVADYALTQETRARSDEWVRTREPDTAERWASYPPGALDAKADTMRAVLAGLTAQSGSLRDAVLALGVALETLAALDAALLVAP